MALEIEDYDGTRIVYFNSPPANGLNMSVVGEFLDALADIREQLSDVHSLIIASRVEGIFIAGADIKMIKGFMDGDNLVDNMIKSNTQLQEAINELEDLPIPVIACISGHALGGGLELSLGCDFRFMARDKALVGLPEVNLGLLPGAGGTQRLSRLIGKSRAKDIIYLSRMLDAEAALNLGIVDKVYDNDVLLDECLQFAASFRGNAGVSIAVIKECIDKGMEVPLQEGLSMEMEALKTLLKTSDAREGISAFLEKRKPAFNSQ